MLEEWGTFFGTPSQEAWDQHELAIHLKFSEKD